MGVYRRPRSTFSFPIGPCREAPRKRATGSLSSGLEHLGILIEGGLIDLEALPAPNRGIANQPSG